VNKTKNRAYIVARDNGFYNDPHPSDLVLGIASEINEAFHADFALKPSEKLDKTEYLSNPVKMEVINKTFEMELIDTQLRLFSLAGYLNVNLTPTDRQKMMIRVACDPFRHCNRSDYLLHLHNMVNRCVEWKYGKWQIAHDMLIVPIMMIENYLSDHGIDTNDLREIKIEHNKKRGYLHSKG